MNKTKRWLLTYITVILVLILGILASQVQANQQSSDTSVEEVKNVIRNYFDIRYQTLSTLDPLNISDFFENVDLQAPSTITELEKLEIERHHVKLNHLRFLQIKLILDFGNLVIDNNLQMATVSVIEGSDVIFEISSPHVSSLRNLQHTITLHKSNGNWKIISDNYEDYLWRLIRITKQPRAEILRAIDNTLNQPINKKSELITTQQATIVTSANTYPYNRSGAVAYADQWALSHNPNYADFSGPGAGDCTNFVSQALKEGGGAIMAFGGTHGVGTAGWYYYNVNDRATAWTWVGDPYKGLYNFIVLEHSWKTGPEGEESSNDYVGFGDIIQYNWDNDSNWDHSVIIVDSIDMGYGNMFHLVDGHSPEVSHYPASSFNYNGIRFIHINFLKGYHTYIPIITSSGGTTLNKVQSENQSAYPAPFKSNNAANPTPQAYPAP